MKQRWSDGDLFAKSYRFSTRVAGESYEIQRIQLRVSEQAREQQLGRFVADETGLEMSEVRRIVEQGGVWVGVARCLDDQRLIRYGDRLSVVFPIGLRYPDVIFDPALVIGHHGELWALNKPLGWYCQPSPWDLRGCLTAAFKRWHDQTCHADDRVHIWSRLDKDTTGVTLLSVHADDRASPLRRSLQEQWESRQVEKRYLALIHGIPATNRGVVDAPIARVDNSRFEVANQGRSAVTEYHVQETYRDAALVELVPKTGRTHQLRVHMASLGHPLLGDIRYGGRVQHQELQVETFFLHANRLALWHPIDQQRLILDAPLPEEFRRCIDQLKS